MLGAVVSPGRMYSKVRDSTPSRRLWVVPWLICAVTVVVLNAVVFSTPAIFESAKDAYNESLQSQVKEGTYTPAQLSHIIETREERLKPIFFIVIHSTRELIWNAIWLGVVSLWLWAGARFLFEGDFDYTRSAEFAGPAMGVVFVSLVVQAAGTLALGDLEFSASLGSLIEFAGATGAADSFLGRVDLLGLWVTIVLGIGLSIWGRGSLFQGIRFMLIAWFVLTFLPVR